MLHISLFLSSYSVFIYFMLMEIPSSQVLNISVHFLVISNFLIVRIFRQISKYLPLKRLFRSTQS